MFVHGKSTIHVWREVQNEKLARARRMRRWMQQALFRPDHRYLSPVICGENAIYGCIHICGEFQNETYPCTPYPETRTISQVSCDRHLSALDVSLM